MHRVNLFLYADAFRPTGRHYLDDGEVAGDANGWGSKTIDTGTALSRKPKANSIFPGGPVKMFPPQDVFLSENCSTVLAQIGSTPILHCEVADIGEGTVSTHKAFSHIFVCANVIDKK
jgi:hypothetical protein